MKRVFSLVIGSFLVLINPSLVAPEKISGNVISWSRHYNGNQVFTPWITPEETKSPVTVQIKLTPETNLRVECVEYTNDDPRAFVYTPEGILIEILNLAHIDDVCKQIENYIFADEPIYEKQHDVQVKLGINHQDLVITYLMAGKLPRCVKRKYSAVDFPYMANVVRGDIPFVDCPGNLATVVNKGASAGGVMNLGPMNSNHIMDYNKNVESVGGQKEFIFETKDSNGKSYKLKCTEYKLTKELVMTKEMRMATALVVREDNEHVVLDKFILKSCEAGTQGININRRPSVAGDEYRIVFKLVEGKCFQRDILRGKDVHLHYYRQTTLERKGAHKVRCPKKWTGDIGLNENVPWFKILFYKRKPFIVSL